MEQELTDKEKVSYQNEVRTDGRCEGEDVIFVTLLRILCLSFRAS